MKLKNREKMPLKYSLRKLRAPYTSFLYYRVYMTLLCKYLTFFEKNHLINEKFMSIPPPSLRYRVGNRPEAKAFLDTGKRISGEIEELLKRASLSIDSFENVLDFGCGCGRTLMWFSNREPKFYGTDVDAEAIGWCKKNLQFADFYVNDPLPPLKYDDCMFDFIYVISVFTHINEDFQYKWIKELHRILRKDGILLATFGGVGTWSWLLPEELRELQEKGFIYRVTNDKKGIFSDWYQTSHHTKDYVINIFSRNFKILTYVEKGIKGFQDAALFQKV